MINRPVKNIVSATGRFLFGAVLVVAIVISLNNIGQAADYPRLTNRSLTIDDVSPGAVTAYTISFNYPTSVMVGSMRLLLCTDGSIDEPCVSPGGDLSSAVLSSQSGNTGFSIDSQSASEIVVTRAPSASATVQSTYQFTNITNPATPQETLYIRIQIYPTNDGSGNFNYASSVVSAITNPIVITTEVPPILFFCAAITIDTWCQTLGGNQIDYGDLSDVTGDVANSQFGVATNATGGYIVTINGNTMTAGLNSIAALPVQSPHTPGTAQFGLNLRANTAPPNGLDVTGTGIGTVAAAYDTPDMFRYVDGETVASSITGTMFNIFTVTYIVNVPSTQPAGVYNTTIAYICTAAF